MTYIRAQVDKEKTLVPEEPKGFFMGLFTRLSKPARKYKYKKVIVLEFISKERQCKDFRNEYRIEYKLNESVAQWLLVENQKITLADKQKEVTLRFTYPTKRNFG